VSITVELTPQELAALKLATRRDNDADAVIQAAREFLRLSRLRELKAVSGKVDFDANWQELEDLELGETGFPK
jgi:hypothetical protein